MHANQSLQPYNTFGIDVKASWVDDFTSETELIQLLPNIRSQNTLITGGGSNILFTKDFEGLFLRNQIMGIKEVYRDAQEVVIEAGAGENWHQFVMDCVGKGFGGIENLSLIPGCVGASPMQNIGAYGVEIKDVFEYLFAIEIATGETRKFSREACQFGYRESVFKQALKGKFIITKVAFRLQLHPKINSKYGVIEEELSKQGITSPSIQDISKAVIAIRSSKLPDPKVLGNAGSFFKNPVVAIEILEHIQKNHPNCPNYPSTPGKVKLAAGWLIETAGWKGRRIGEVGVHEKQALVLVNYGKAEGTEVFALSEAIINDIWEKFNIRLEREVNIY
jgi:UDP-N-acetylmuramate dehydrogenase